MRTILCNCIFLLLAVPCSGQQLAVIGARRCSDGLLVEVRLSNLQQSANISTPLSADYKRGHTLHSARIEYFDASTNKWNFTERGGDLHPAGTRVLEPGEWVNDLVEAGLYRLAGAAIGNVMFRAAVYYGIGNEKTFRTAVSSPFKLSDSSFAEFYEEPWMKAIEAECKHSADN